MKKLFKISFAAVLAVLCLSLSVVTAFAAKGELTINEDAVAVEGDTVTYTLNMGDCTEELEGIQMQFMYDSEYLEVDADSLDFPNMNGVVSNAGIADVILFTWTDVMNLADFTKTAPLVTVDFKVKKAGETAITYFITEMYGSDVTYLKSFTLTNDIAVNGEVVVKGASPLIVSDSDLQNQYQGSFVNYADGKGEQNGSGEDHVAVTGATGASVTDSDVIDVNKGGNNVMTIVTVVSIIVVVLAIIAVIILRNRFVKKPEDK
ncbi:MAG: hypothetical protein J1E96_05330 [Ruminococcus sp.]|nr:hypothetical protein [Ruminococcus sp.]